MTPQMKQQIFLLVYAGQALFEIFGIGQKKIDGGQGLLCLIVAVQIDRCVIDLLKVLIVHNRIIDN
jgi:hypothetical protein